MSVVSIEKTDGTNGAIVTTGIEKVKMRTTATAAGAGSTGVVGKITKLASAVMSALLPACEINQLSDRSEQLIRDCKDRLNAQ